MITGLTACDKDEKGTDYFLSAEVNGVEITIIETHKYTRREVVASEARFDGHRPQHFSISAEPWNNTGDGGLKAITFTIPIELREGKHYFNNEDVFVDDDTVLAQISLWDDVSAGLFTDYHSVDGYIKITRYSGRIIEGVFSFNGESRDGHTVSVTNGRFRTDMI